MGFVSTTTSTNTAAAAYAAAAQTIILECSLELTWFIVIIMISPSRM
jgi:hypothetical protein